MQESNLEAFKTAILGKVSDNQLAEVWIILLTQLIEDIERYQLLRLNKLDIKSYYVRLIWISFSFPTPELEGRSNLTSLDIQIKKLRDNSLKTIRDGARRMREDPREIRDMLTDIEIWADKLKALAEEVPTQEEKCSSELKGALSDLVRRKQILLHRCGGRN